MPAIEDRRASSEIIGGAYKLFLNRIPVLPFRWRRALYKSYVNGLSERAFGIYAGQVVETICLKKSVSDQFRNTDLELKELIRSVPRLDKVRGVLREHIRRHRRKYNLKA